jgi:hypothetical protein
MDTFVGFTKNDLVSSIDSFFDEYALAHPNAVTTTRTNSHLYSTYINILVECKTLASGYQFYTRVGYKTFNFSRNKIYWLLCNASLTGFSSQIQSFIIKTNDPSLSDRDYILMFYISLQNIEVQDAIRNIPLGMLRDMFLPVAEENLKKWMLSS